MAPPPRLRVLDALRRGSRTVNDLAATLRVTDNAVRGHLAALERDGLVRRRGVVRSGTAGKPAAEYEITAAADLFLSRAYAPALGALVEALGARLSPRALRATLIDAGRRLVPAGRRPATLAAAGRAAREILGDLGASAHVTVEESHADITGDGCPLGDAVARQPVTCTMVEALIAARTGRHVEQRCVHGERPRCSFRIGDAR